MKKIIICLTVLLATFYSCQKNELNPISESTILPPAGRINSASDFEAQKQAFNLMSPGERYNLWKHHLDVARAQFLQTSSAKVALIDQLYPYLSSSTFDGNSTSANILLNYVVPTWLVNAKTVFTQMELYDLVNDPTEDEIGSRLAPPEIGQLPGETPAPCWCNGGTSGFSCARIRLGFPPSYETGICELVGECTSKKMGCGFLWLSACNGNHCNFG